MIFISTLIIVALIALPKLSILFCSQTIIRVTSIILIYAGALSFNALYIQSIGSGIGIYSGLLHVTQISQLFETFLLFIGSLILISFIISQKKKRIQNDNNVLAKYRNEILIKLNQIRNKFYKSFTLESGKYTLIILFSTLGSQLLISSADLITMYLSIELQSFGVYILSTLFRDSMSATSAGLKYFLLGGLSSSLILLGASLVYSSTGFTNLEAIYTAVSFSNENLINDSLTLGLVVIIIGLLFKIAAAPLHQWAPDVYNDSPTVTTIWLTIMPKIGILIFLLDLFMGIINQGHLNLENNLALSSNINSLDLNSYLLNEENNLGSIDQNISSLLSNELSNITNIEVLAEDRLKLLLLLSSLLSLLIGTIVGLAQPKLKRLLTYSTISHIGFILLALAIGSEKSLESFTFYIIQYSITNLNTFLIILAFGYLLGKALVKDKKEEEIEKAYQLYLESIGDSLTEYDLKMEEARKKQRAHRLSLVTKGNEDNDIILIDELKSQYICYPLLAISLAICLFSLAGIPPLLGFFSKLMVLYSGILSGKYFITIIAIISSVISSFYYLKIIRVMFTPLPSEDNVKTSDSKITLDSAPDLAVSGHAIAKDEPTFILDHDHDSEEKFNKFNADYNTYILTNYHAFLISALTLSILLFILKPSILLNSTQLFSLNFFNC